MLIDCSTNALHDERRVIEMFLSFSNICTALTAMEDASWTERDAFWKFELFLSQMPNAYDVVTMK